MALVNNLVVERIRRAVMLHSDTGEILWTINQITNPTLTLSAEQAEAVDALGTPIAKFDRAKTAEFSAENSLFDLGLLAAQSGTSVDTAASDNKYNVPYFDEIKVTTADTITLTQTPAAGTLKFIYAIAGDGTLGEKFTVGSSASGNTVSVAGKTVTFASGKAPAGDYFFAYYEYEVDGTTGKSADRVVATATNFPTAGKLIVEAIAVDPCSVSVMHAIYLCFDNAKLTSDLDITFGTDMTHPFTIECMQDYCDHERKLFTIVCPDAAVAV
jgi:hypothetical protein